MRSLVVGLGKSGVAATKLLEHQGDTVVGYDDSQKTALPNLLEFDRLILSPGVPLTHPLVVRAKEISMPIVGEAELALSQFYQKAIAITGTNGKTTVTLLISHVLKTAGFSAPAVGNVGEPLSAYMLYAKPEDIAVVELSSFQLDTLHSNRFDMGFILNITPDHLDRYDSMEAYAASKCHLQACLKPGGALWVHESVAREFKGHLKEGYFTYGQNESCTLSVNQVAFLRKFAVGLHDQDNHLAAWIACRPYVSEEDFIRAVATFKKPLHRIEWVATVDEVEFVNDSKGTNLDATIKAVEMMQKPVILIAGGVDKGASYAAWKKPFAKKVRSVVAIGQAAPLIARDLAPEYKVEIVPNLEEAVLYSQREAGAGDVILLSPGCSSYDMFRDYAHRGEEFKRIVYRLQEKKG